MPVNNNRLGGLTSKDAGRIGRGIQKVERMPLGQQKTSDTTPYHVTVAFAQLTENLGSGLYSAKEVLVSVNNGVYSWSKRTNGRTWNQADNTPNPLFDIALGENLSIGDIVLVMRTNEEGSLNAKSKWCIISSAVVTEDYLETDKSCDWGTKEIEVRDENGQLVEIIVLPAIEFRNDIPRVSQVSRTGQRLNVGTIADGNCAYGGQEESTSSSNLGIERHYKFIWRKSTPTINYLLPETLFTVEDSSGDVNQLDNQNELWIRFKHRFSGQTMEIDHGVISESLLNSNDDLLHPYTNPDTSNRGEFFVNTKADGTGTWISVIVDAKGHIVCINNVCATYDPPDETTDGEVELTDLDYPTSTGSLYNYESTQTNNIVDAGGVDTNDFNKNNALSYIAYTGTGIELDIGFAKSVNQSAVANATEYNGAGTGGNDDNIFIDYSKILDGSEIVLSTTLTETGNSDTDSVTSTIVWLDSEYDTTPIPNDGSTFDVKTELTDNCAGGGARQTRLDGLDEYELVTYLYYKTDGFDIDNEVGVAGGAAGYIAKNEETIDDQTTYSGATISFGGLDFPDNREGSIVVARTYVNFFTANGVLARQTGFCEICNNNNYVEVEALIDGDAATHTVETVPDAEVQLKGTIEDFNGLKYFVFDDVADYITLEYDIKKGGADTNEWSQNGDDGLITLKLNNQSIIFGVEFEFDKDDVNLLFERTVQITNTRPGPTDGFEFSVGYFQVPNDVTELEDLYGLQYVVNVNTPGIDPDATDSFVLTEEELIPASQVHYYPWVSDYNDYEGTQNATAPSNPGGFQTDPAGLYAENVVQIAHTGDNARISDIGRIDSTIGDPKSFSWKIQCYIKEEAPTQRYYPPTDQFFTSPSSVYDRQDNDYWGVDLTPFGITSLLNKWHTLIVTYDHVTDDEKIYIAVDGVDSSLQLINTINTGQRASVYYHGGDYFGRFFSGYFRRTRVFTGVLTASEMQAIYDADT